MQIGTAVPSKFELSQVKHHFIHNKSIFENYTVGDFEKEALLLLDQLFIKNDFAILVGGSGLYVDAIIKGLDTFPNIEKFIREQVKSDFEEKGISYLQAILQKLDPKYYNKLLTENPQTLQNPHRMMRFVEVCIGSEKPYSSYLNSEKNHRNFTPIIIGLEANRDIIYERINQRVDLMISDGLLSEAENLYPYKNLNALQTVGYREIFDYLDKKTNLEFAIQEIKKNTRRFSKRQMTWFKKTENVNWFDITNSVEKIHTFINTNINKQ